MAVDDVLDMIKNEEVKVVDLRFTDTRGKEQHLSVPVGVVDEDLFEDGKMFDGSSIAGWKGISESDMVLMPDTDTAVMDPFPMRTLCLCVATCSNPPPWKAMTGARGPLHVAPRRT